jgi:hypothetical protein
MQINVNRIFRRFSRRLRATRRDATRYPPLLTLDFTHERGPRRAGGRCVHHCCRDGVFIERRLVPMEAEAEVEAAIRAPARSDVLQPVRPPACVSGSAYFAAARCAQAGRSAAAGAGGASILGAPLTLAMIFASSSASLQSEHLPHTQNTAWRSGA